MPSRLFTLYQRKRIININANIIAAGLLALIPTAAAVWIFKLSVPPQDPWIYTGVSVIADIIADVTIYFLLHWVANHWRPVRGGSEHERAALEAKPPPYWKDASLVQFERALLSPLYYIIAAGLMQLLQTQFAMRAGWAVLIAFPVGLVATRILHTIWGLRTGRFREHHQMPHNCNGGSAGAPPRPADSDAA